MQGSWRYAWGEQGGSDGGGAHAPAAGAAIFRMMDERAGRRKHFSGEKDAAVSAAAEAAAAPAGSSLAVASNWICLATGWRTAGGHRQTTRIGLGHLVFEGKYGAPRRRGWAGGVRGSVGRDCFHCARTIAEFHRFDNGQAAAPDRRVVRLSGGGRPRLAAAGRPAIPIGPLSGAGDFAGRGN